MNKKKINESAPDPIYILLPVCVEFETDLFHSYLKHSIARTRFGDHYLENAMKSGMESEKISVEKGDLSTNWKLMQTNEEKIRQAKLLGFWTVCSFPSMGRGVFGSEWNPSLKRSVEIIGEAPMNDEAINSIIFGKLKIRIMELSVMPSTIAKLKRFEKVPNWISKYNECVISQKTKSFDVAQEFVEDCWKALKVGGFASKQPIISNLPPKRSNASSIDFTGDNLNTVGDKEMNDQANSNVDESHSAPLTSNSDATRSEHISTRRPCHLMGVTRNSSASPDSNTISAAKRARLSENPYNETLQTAVQEIRENVMNLTTWLGSVVSSESHTCIGSDQLHVMVFKQKDDEIVQLKTCLQMLEKEHECLKKSFDKANGEMEKQLDLTNSLQKGMDASSILHEKSERDLSISLNVIRELQAKLNVENNTKEKHEEFQANLQAQINCLSGKLSDGAVQSMEKDRMYKEIHAENSILKEQLFVLKNEKDTENILNQSLRETNKKHEEVVPDLQTQIHCLSQQLTDTAIHIQKNESLKDELAVFKGQSAELVARFGTEIENLDWQLKEKDRMHAEIVAENSKLKEQLVVLNSEKDAENILNQSLRETNKKHEEVVSNLQTQIHCLTQQLTDTTIHIQKSESLKDELAVFKGQSVELVARFGTEIENLDWQLKEKDRMHAEIVAENSKLKEQLVVLNSENEQKSESLTDPTRENDQRIAIPTTNSEPLHECDPTVRKNPRRRKKKLGI